MTLRCRPSLSHHLDHNLATPRAGVELDDQNLLPRAEGQRAIHERDRQRRPQQRRAHVARPVVVAPAQVMAVFAAPRRELFEEAVEIGNRAGLELDVVTAAVDPVTNTVTTPERKPDSFNAPATFVVMSWASSWPDVERWRRTVWIMRSLSTEDHVGLAELERAHFQACSPDDGAASSPCSL